VRGLNDFFFGERVGVLLGGVEEREREREAVLMSG